MTRGSASSRTNGRRSFGKIEKMRPSGRFQASYIGPDGGRHKAPDTFELRSRAADWLEDERELMDSARWTPPSVRALGGSRRLADYATEWLEHRRTRKGRLSPRTRKLYRQQLDDHVLPALGHLRLVDLTRPAIVRWFRTLPDNTKLASACFNLLHAILNSAIEEEVLTGVNPCVLRGAGSPPARRNLPRLVTPAQIQVIISIMPRRYGAMILIAFWCGLRWSEFIDLRRGELDLRDPNDAWIRLEHSAGDDEDGEPTSGPVKAGEDRGRYVSIPPHLVPVLRAHIREFSLGIEGLIFPAATNPNKHLQHGTIYKTWQAACIKAGVPGLRIHDLRHCNAVMARQVGADPYNVMNRLGQSTLAAALQYQQVQPAEQRELAAQLSARFGQ